MSVCGQSNFHKIDWYFGFVIQVKSYMVQFLRGLEFCHMRGVLHRDLTTANLLVNSQGKLKIADFGLAHVMSDEDKGQGLSCNVVTLWNRRASNPPILDRHAPVFSRGTYSMLSQTTGAAPGLLSVWARGRHMERGMRVRGALDGSHSLSGYGRTGPDREDLPGHGGADRNDLARSHQPSTVISFSFDYSCATTARHELMCQTYECNGLSDVCRYCMLNRSHCIDKLEDIMRYRGISDLVALRLLRNLLRLTPSMRITASQALEVCPQSCC